MNRRRLLAVTLLAVATGAGAGARLAGQEALGRADSLAQAREQRARGELAEAENLLRNALEAGASAELRVELGGVLVERAQALDTTSDLGRSLAHGVLEEALSHYVDAGALPAGAVDGALGAATCHALLDRPEMAQASLRTALDRLRAGDAPVPQRRRLVQELVHFLAATGHRDTAEAEVAAARDAGDLDAAGAALERLRIVSTLRAEAEALPAALAALELGAKPFDIAYLSWDAFGAQSLEAMLHLYSRLLEVKPAVAALRYYRGVVRLRMGDAAGAIEDLDLELCREDPETGARARLELARARLRLREPEAALVEYERLLDDPELVREAVAGLIWVAVARAQARQFEGALALYERVLEREPQNAYGHLGRALCHRSLGDLERAAQAYEAGLAALPDELQLLNDYALLLRVEGKREAATELFERGLGGGSADAGENLGIIALRERHDAAAAGGLFARTLLLDPTRPRIRFYREICLTPAPAPAVTGARR